MAPYETRLVLSVQDADISRTRSITNDNFCMQETMKLEKGYHRVTLTCEKSFVPARLWDTPDQRMFYIGLKEMKFIKTEETNREGTE